MGKKTVKKEKMKATVQLQQASLYVDAFLRIFKQTKTDI